MNERKKNIMRKEVWEACIFLRKENISVSPCIIDLMREAALEKIERI